MIVPPDMPESRPLWQVETFTLRSVGVCHFSERQLRRSQGILDDLLGGCVAVPPVEMSGFEPEYPYGSLVGFCQGSCHTPPRDYPDVSRLVAIPMGSRLPCNCLDNLGGPQGIRTLTFDLARIVRSHYAKGPCASTRRTSSAPANTRLRSRQRSHYSTSTRSVKCFRDLSFLLLNVKLTLH
jgi:hypothetical protein